MRPAVITDTVDRIFIPIHINFTETDPRLSGHLIEAVLDTGGIYFICNSDILSEMEIDPDESLGPQVIHVRGGKILGYLFRLQLTFKAEAGMGESLSIEITALVSDEWMLPPYLGFQGCMERMKFAIDPTPNNELFYFGVL